MRQATEIYLNNYGPACAIRSGRLWFACMSSLQEIELAIGSLSPEDQARLLRDLPALLPAWEGELAWRRIIREPAPNAALSRLVDTVDAEFRTNPNAFPEITDSDFERNS